MVLNLTVSIGTINGLIFYASIVKTSESTGIFFPNGSISVLSQFIAWLNLDLGIETCFYMSASTTAMQYDSVYGLPSISSGGAHQEVWASWVLAGGSEERTDQENSGSV